MESGLFLKLAVSKDRNEILDITRQYLIIYVIGFIFNYLLTIIMEALRAIVKFN